MNRALVIGSRGQDGVLLTSLLVDRGWEVSGLVRGDLDLCHFPSVKEVLSSGYDHVYYLAAYHQSSQDSALACERELYEKSTQVHVEGLLNFLDAIRSVAPTTRVFYAASSLVFGSPEQELQDEDTPLNPLCIYGITKSNGIQLCRYFREKHGIFASAGILFNHESPLRQRKFVIPKIIHGAIAISRGSTQKLQLGDLSARVDWGYATDYVDAMHRILCLDCPDDFVVASGETHSVQDVVETVFAALGLNWTQHIVETPSLLTRQRTVLRGDSSKLRQRTGWEPTVDFSTMILRLLDIAKNA
jgi:GDPmannose 4,6-dehydratase